MAQGRRPGPLGAGTRTAPIIDEGTSNRQPSPLPGPLGTQHSSHGWISWAVDQITSAKNWETIDHYAVYLLGPQSFGLGVVTGIAAALVDTVVELMDLLATFVLADVEDTAQHSSGWSSWIDPAVAADYFFHEALLERKKKRDTFLEEIRFIVLHPYIFGGGVVTAMRNAVKSGLVSEQSVEKYFAAIVSNHSRADPW